MIYSPHRFNIRAKCSITLGHALVCCLIATFSASSFAGEMDKRGSDAANGNRHKDLSSKTQLNAALLLLAAKMTISPDQITVVKHEKVMWPSSALGCPKSGEMYSQAEVPGTRIIFQIGNQVFHYHASLTGTPFNCPDRRRLNIRTGAGEI